jgi:hypothetical protein
MEIESIIPVLDPATFKRSPRTVMKPITTPPNIAAIGMVSSNAEITDFSL